MRPARFPSPRTPSLSGRRAPTVDAVARNLDALLGLREAAGKALFEQGLRREDLTTALAVGKQEIGELTARTDKRAGRLSKARAGHSSIQARRTFLLGRAIALDRVAVTSATMADAALAAANAEQALAAAASAAGFDTLAEVLQIAAIDIEQLHRRVRTADDERAGLAAQLRDPQFAGLSADDRVDITGIESRAASAAVTAEQAITQSHATADRRDRVALAAQRLRAAWLDREPVCAKESESRR